MNTSHHQLLVLRDSEVLFDFGDKPKAFYKVQTGCLKLSARRPLTRGRVASPEFVTRIVGPGEFFGFRQLLLDGEYNVAAKALRPTEVQVYAKELLGDQGSTEILKAVSAQLVHDLEASELNNQLHYLASVQERIVYQIVLLAERFGLPSSRGISLNLKLTRNELAQLAGTINESLSRHLTELKNAGLVDIFGKEIVIKDMQGLKAKSGNFHGKSAK